MGGDYGYINQKQKLYKMFGSNFQVTSTKYTRTGRVTKTTAVSATMNRVSCTIMDTTKSYLVTISNDGIRLSTKSVLVIVFSSVCDVCDANTGTCTRKVGAI